MTMGPTPEQVAAQVAMIYQHRADARVIGIHTPGTWLGGTTLQMHGETLPVVFCPSALHISAALVAQPPDGPPQVIVTPLEERQLGLDVLARLSGRRLYRVDRWQMVRDLFRARDVDPRLAVHEWLADALLQHIPEGGYPPVASGVLDADTAWGHLLTQHLGLPDGRPDAAMLVTWSTVEQHLRRYEALPAGFRAALRQRLEDTAGAVGVTLFEALVAGHGALLLPLGVVCEVLFSPAGRQEMSLAQARARLEPYVGGHAVSAAVAQAWFTASKSVLAALPEAEVYSWLDRSHTLLVDLKATPHSALSTVLVAGFNQRLEQCAEVLQRLLCGQATLEQLQGSVDRVAAHQEAARQPARRQRLDMALRLARYLRTGQHAAMPASLAQAVAAYAAHGGYVDWARRYLSAGDETAALATAFGVLAEQVRQIREQQNRQFAEVLADWHKTPRVVAGIIPIEQALARFVARLAQSTPVLLLVLDGMSYAVFVELCDDLKRRGWVELTDQPGHPLPLLVSTVPSVTDMSRASLLAGKLKRGSSATEKQDFAAHAELLAASRPGLPPVLFHKGELVEAGAPGVSEVVREALRNAHQRVVGVVLNAVDDHLARSDQLRFVWTVEQFHHLDTLLYEAHLAQRAVVLTSDHGHVLEAGTRRLPGEAEERWRPFSEVLAEEETVFTGVRVAQVAGVTGLIVPWSETVRYGQKKQGYHGGATPQEVLVPFAILARGRAIAGWEEVPDHQPVWWHLADTLLENTPAVPVGQARRARLPVTGQGGLFADVAASRAAASQADWIARLLGSAVFAAQRRLVGRQAPDDRLVQTCLQALDERHGCISRQMLAQVLGLSDVRLRRLLAGLQRLLNVDGYHIIAVDEGAGTITLNRQLLEQHFLG